jgi:hypothetical protein
MHHFTELSVLKKKSPDSATFQQIQFPRSTSLQLLPTSVQSRPTEAAMINFEESPFLYLNTAHLFRILNCGIAKIFFKDSSRNSS